MTPQDLGLPAKIKSWRPGQYEAIEDIAEVLLKHLLKPGHDADLDDLAVGKHDRAGGAFYLLDASCGAGKSIIGIAATRRILQGLNAFSRITIDQSESIHCIYLCKTKQLQDQILTEFPEARTVKGRTNYPCGLVPNKFPKVTAEDCIEGCPLKKPENQINCPYFHAKNLALAASIAVLNQSYFLAEANGPGQFSTNTMLIVDECIPSGTKISTPSGDKAVESVKRGDFVLGFDGKKIVQTIVEEVSCRQTKEKIVSTNGLYSTTKHPIWTKNRGYVPASHINQFDRVGMIVYNNKYERPYLRTMWADIQSEESIEFYGKTFSLLLQGLFWEKQGWQTASGAHKNMCAMWEGIPSQNPKTELLFPELPFTAYYPSRKMGNGNGAASSRKELSRSARKIACISALRQKSYLQTRGKTEGPNGIKGKRMENYPQWRKWASFTVTPEDFSVSTRLAGRICHPDWWTCEWITYLLQDRYCQSSLENCGRGGWSDSQLSKNERVGQEKRQFSQFYRLENSSVQEQGSFEKSRTGSPENRTVYNLKTTTGNYFANNILVHNCDTLEGELMSHIQLTVTQKTLDQLKHYPENYDELASWREWAVSAPIDRLVERSERQMPLLFDPRSGKSLGDMTDSQIEIHKGIVRLRALQRKLNRFAMEVNDNWVFYEEKNDKGETSWIFKPVFVSDYAFDYCWRHTRSVLGMSGTILDHKLMADSLGISLEAVKYHKIPSLFPPERRLIYYQGIANLTRDTLNSELPKIAEAVDSILQKHAENKVLVHTTSYQIRDYLMANLTPSERLITHGSENRAEKLEEFKKSTTSLVMLSPSFDRGVDLVDAQCRAIIIVKVPYPNLADLQIKKRMEAPGGNLWYLTTAVRTIIQMTGRGMRHENDFCESYILDTQFRRLFGRVRHLFPDWWQKALRW